MNIYGVYLTKIISKEDWFKAEKIVKAKKECSNVPKHHQQTLTYLSTHQFKQIEFYNLINFCLLIHVKKLKCMICCFGNGK